MLNVEWVQRKAVAIATLAALLLGGCKSDSKPRTSVADTTADPIVSLTALKKLAGTQEELANLMGAYQELWQQNTETATALAKEQGAQNRLDAAQTAENERKADNGKRMFWCGIGAGVAGLAAIALPLFGVPGIPKIGGLLIVAGGVLVILPSLIDAAEPAVQYGSYAGVAILVGMGIVQLRSNWINAKAGRVDAAALNPSDPLTPREATAIKREMLPGYDKAFSAEKQRAEEREAMRLLAQTQEVATLEGTQ